MANKYIYETVSKFARGVKRLLLGSSLVVLGACGSNSTSDNTVANPAGGTEQRSQEIATLDLTRVSLIESLSTLYPKGKLPAEQLISANKLLAQNPAALSPQFTKVGAIKPQAFTSVITDFQPVFRIQNTTLYGSYFFTIYDSEKTSALSLNPNWKLEGPAFYASPAAGTDLSPVYRFRNKVNGSYVFSIYEEERQSLNTTYASTFAEEGVAWHARQTPAAGFTELYRFRNKTNGTYLFTAYNAERQAIVDGFADTFVYEGVAYYVQVTPNYNNNPIPPVPDPVTNAATLAGVDANNNGVRDDAERTIAANTIGQTVYERNLEIAKNYGKLAASQLTTRDDVKSNVKATHCLIIKNPDGMKSKDIAFLIGNTIERQAELRKTAKLFAGGFINSEECN
jgi:Repeat of unknown function (DUF5648)